MGRRIDRSLRTSASRAVTPIWRSHWNGGCGANTGASCGGPCRGDATRHFETIAVRSASDRPRPNIALNATRGLHELPPRSRIIKNPKAVSGPPKGDPTRGCGSSWRGQGQRRRVSQHCCRCAPVPNLLATDAAGPPCIDCYEKELLLSTAKILLVRVN